MHASSILPSFVFIGVNFHAEDSTGVSLAVILVVGILVVIIPVGAMYCGIPLGMCYCWWKQRKVRKQGSQRRRV